MKENKSEVVFIAYSDKIANLIEMANDYKILKMNYGIDLIVKRRTILVLLRIL